MTQYRRQGPRWYNIWLPLLLLMLGGLLVLEPQGSLSPAGYPITQIVLALLMYGVVAIWLWCNRRAVLNQAYEHAQAQEHRHAAGQQQRDGGMSDHEPWEEVRPPWQSNGHYTDMQRRR